MVARGLGAVPGDDAHSYTPPVNFGAVQTVSLHEPTCWCLDISMEHSPILQASLGSIAGLRARSVGNPTTSCDLHDGSPMRGMCHCTGVALKRPGSCSDNGLLRGCDVIVARR